MHYLKYKEPKISSKSSNNSLNFPNKEKINIQDLKASKISPLIIKFNISLVKITFNNKTIHILSILNRDKAMPGYILIKNKVMQGYILMKDKTLECKTNKYLNQFHLKSHSTLSFKWNLFNKKVRKEKWN